jgi:hypothetical protein
MTKKTIQMAGVTTTLTHVGQGIVTVYATNTSLDVLQRFAKFGKENLNFHNVEIEYDDFLEEYELLGNC